MKKPSSPQIPLVPIGARVTAVRMGWGETVTGTYRVMHDKYPGVDYLENGIEIWTNVRPETIEIIEEALGLDVEITDIV